MLKLKFRIPLYLLLFQVSLLYGQYFEWVDAEETGYNLNPNMVKVVTDLMGYALYFSRAPIPYPKGKFLQISDSSHIPNIDSQKNAFIHYGIYGYRKDFLLSIPGMEPSFLEKVEGLEQLRILANGYKIKMIETPYRSIGVDTPEDIIIVEELIKQNQAD